MKLDILTGTERIVAGSTLLVRSSMLIRADESFYEKVGEDFDVSETEELVLQGRFNNSFNIMLTEFSIDSFDMVEVNEAYRVNFSTTFTVPSNIIVDDEEDFYLQFGLYTDTEDFLGASSDTITVYPHDEVEFGLKDSVTSLTKPLLIEGVVETDQQDLTLTMQTPDSVEFVTFPAEVVQTNNDTKTIRNYYRPNQLWRIVNGREEIIVHNPIFHATQPTYTTVDQSLPQGYDLENSYQIFMMPSLKPYTATWHTNEDVLGISSHWLFNTSMMQAMKEMFSYIERGTRFTGIAESALSNADGANFLKMGMDYFNSLEKATNFDMTRADGSMRRMLVICASHEALFSRQLEEAIKRFDFSGQATTLTVDTAEALEQARVVLEQQINEVVRPYKRALYTSGVRGGDGSDSSILGKKAPMAAGFTYSQVGNAGFRFVGVQSSYLTTKMVMF